MAQIKPYDWADNVPYYIEFNERAYTVNEENRGEMQNGTYIINNITNGNANINSTDNSVRLILSRHDTKLLYAPNPLCNKSDFIRSPSA